MPNNEIVLAMSSGVVLLVLIVLVVMYIMKVKFMLKAVVWVKKLMGTSLKEQATETCPKSDFSTYADEDDELWDIIIDEEKCPVKSTDTDTSTSTGELTRVQKVNLISSNCSDYKYDFIMGNGSRWDQEMLDKWIKFPRGSCESLQSYTFSDAEKSWLLTQLGTKCTSINPVNYTGLDLYSTWASTNPICQTPSGVTLSTGPDRKTFYHPTTLSQSIHFGLRPSLTGPGTITFGYGGSMSTATYTYNESSNMITFTGVPVGSYLAGVTARYINQTLTINTTAWLNTNPFLTAGFKERVFTNPNLQDGVTERVKILNETTLQWTKGTQVSNVRIFMLMYQNTAGIINKDSNDSSAFPYTGITFSTPSPSQEVTELIFGGTTRWTSVDPRDIRNIIGTSKTYYRSGSNQGITFTSASLNSATFVNVPGITTPVSYTTVYEPSSLRWEITFGTDFLTLGRIGYLSQTGFSMSTNTFSENQGENVEQTYTIRDGLRNIIGYSASDQLNAGDNIESNFWIGFKVPDQNKVLNMLESSPSIMTVWEKRDNDYQRFIITGDGRMINRQKGGIVPSTASIGTTLQNSDVALGKFDYDWTTKQLKFAMTLGAQVFEYCVTRTGLNDGANVKLQMCDNADNNQRWDVIPVRNRLHIVGDQSKSMHVDSGQASTDDKRVIGWGDINNGNADFQFDPRTGQIKFKDSRTHCLSTSFDPATNVTKTLIKTCNVTNPKMKWVYDGLAEGRPANTALGGETQNFINMYSGQCLTFNGNGTDLITTQCNSTNQNQKWNLI